MKIVFVLSGWAEVASTHQVTQVGPGTILTIRAGLECWCVPTGPVRTGTIYIDQDFLTDHLRWLPRTQPLVHLLANTLDGDDQFGELQLPQSSMRDLAPRLVHLAQLRDRTGEELAMLSMTADVLDAVGRTAGTASGHTTGTAARPAVPRPEVARAVGLLRSDLTRVWRIEDLAQEAALSTSQLGRLFRSQIGVSPAAYLGQLRTDRMAELLATASIGVGEAARAAGWQNTTVASRAFRRRYGMSPRAFAARRNIS